MTTIRTWWPENPKPGNCGDLLGPFILRRYGYTVERCDQSRPDWLFCGSILKYAKPSTYVVGTGTMRASDKLCPTARYLMVRGPLTRDAVNRSKANCPENYGDPALVLPMIVNGTVPRDAGPTLIPHYVDKDSRIAREWKGRKLDILNADPLVVINAIRQSEVVFSSSLHGIIIAHAFGMPAAWVKMSEKLSGNPANLKFHDYAASVGIELIPYTSVAEAVPILPPAATMLMVQAKLHNLFKNL